MSSMKIVACVGTLGAGKTTLMMHTLRTLAESGYSKEKLAYILNDEGTLDGALADRIAQVL